MCSMHVLLLPRVMLTRYCDRDTRGVSERVPVLSRSNRVLLGYINCCVCDTGKDRREGGRTVRVTYLLRIF